MKRSKLATLLLTAGLAALVPLTTAAETLRVVSWGGSYVRSQILGFIRPFEQSTGIDVEGLEYAGGIGEIRAQVESWNVRWDAVDLQLFDAIKACDAGLLEKLDPDTLPPAPDGTPAREDFIDGALTECGVGNVIGSTVVAYDSDQLPSEPTHLEDFFDTRKFPGRRALRRTPKVNLEWALIADGVEPDSVYAELETRDGVDRAFRMLDRIKPVLSWWRTGSEAVQLLESGKVAMSSVYSGRVHATADAQTPLKIVWDHQVWYLDVWSIPMNGENIDTAREFIRFATSTRSLANQAGYIPYGPARRSSMALLAPEVRRRLPTAEENFRTAFESDDRWWSENIDRLNHEFRQWLKREVMVPERLRR